MHASAVLAVLTGLSFLVAGASASEQADELRALKGSDGDMVLYQKAHGPKRGYHNLLIQGRTFDSFVFEGNLRAPSHTTHYGLVFRYKDQGNFYRLVLRPANDLFRVEKVIEGQSDEYRPMYIR